MAQSPFQTKYETSRAYKNVKRFELRCLKDGNSRTMLDDGPFDHPSKTAQSGRANCLLQMAKRMPDPLISGDEVPVLVWDGDGPAPKVYDTRINAFVSPQRMSDHLRKVMEYCTGKRNELEDRAKATRTDQKRAGEEQLAAAATATLVALGAQISKPVTSSVAAPVAAPVAVRKP